VTSLGALAGQIEGGERGAEADVVADSHQHVGGRRPVAHARSQSLEIVAERFELVGC
jgi:hypothetical protein